MGEAAAFGAAAREVAVGMAGLELPAGAGEEPHAETMSAKDMIMRTVTNLIRNLDVFDNRGLPFRALPC